MPRKKSGMDERESSQIGTIMVRKLSQAGSAATL
jgi:hypothetical protein